MIITSDPVSGHSTRVGVALDGRGILGNTLIMEWYRQIWMVVVDDLVLLQIVMVKNRTIMLLQISRRLRLVALDRQHWNNVRTCTQLVEMMQPVLKLILASMLLVATS